MNKLGNLKGQVSLGLLTSVIAPFLLASIGLAWNAIAKSDKAVEQAVRAVERVAAVEGDVKEIKTDVRWIKDNLITLQASVQELVKNQRQLQR